MPARRPLVRPMAGWWRGNPYYWGYLAREATALFVAAYGFVLLAGVVQLARGEAEFARWLEWLATPASIAFHWVLLAVFAYHTYSWFAIMPKTMPAVMVGGRRLAPAVITTLGIAASLASSAALLAILRALAR